MSSRRREPADPAKVVGYVRVSTDEQALSPEGQRVDLEAWCRRQDAVCVATVLRHRRVRSSAPRATAGAPGRPRGAVAEAYGDPVVLGGLTSSLVARADALVTPMSKDTELHHIVKVTRSDVLRLAIQHGLAALERKHGRKT